jgi:hypothetical protein
VISCKNISNRFESITPVIAWESGTNVRTAMKDDPQLTFSTLTALLMDAVSYLDMNKTLRDENDFIHAVRNLIDDFPVMKLEEWKVIMDRLKAGKYGKMYERLKLPELSEIFMQYEGERAEMMERNIKDSKNDDLKKLDDIPITDEQKGKWNDFVKGLNLPKSDTDRKGRWEHIYHPNSTE